MTQNCCIWKRSDCISIVSIVSEINKFYGKEIALLLADRIIQWSQKVQRNTTLTKKILWNELRANKLGVHFRRQQVIQGFIVDFYCHKAGLVVEVDGDIHDLQKEEDERREKALSEMGLRIVRFGNDEVIRGLYAVVGKIKGFINLW